jgi:hypothetical protein
MNFEPLYEVWAPLDGRWSPWVKPVLFAADARPSVSGLSAGHFAREFSWLPTADLRTALIVDCPGDESLAIGVAAARVGFRPVPLFNACHGKNEVISQSPLFAVIEQATDELRTASLTPDAPPAFLLDSRRLTPDRPPQPGDFDNRWMVFPQDFPSANLLLASGIEMVVVVQPSAGSPQQDLSQVLLRWQKAGLALRSVSTGGGDQATPQELVVPKPRYGWLWAGFLVALGLRMHGAGGFGAVVPQPSQSSGYRSYG